MNGWTDRTQVSVATAPQTRDAVTRKTRKSPPSPSRRRRNSKERRDLPNDKVKDPQPVARAASPPPAPQWRRDLPYPAVAFPLNVCHLPWRNVDFERAESANAG